MKRKILSLLLIAALLAVMMPMSAFADTGGLIVSSTSIHSGDSFTISYVVPNETTKVGSISLKINYDKTKLKITSVNWKSFSNSSPTGSNVSEAQSFGILSGVWENENNEITIPASTELVKAEFTTADGASAGDTQFTIEQISIKGGAMGTDDLNSIAGVTMTGKTVSIELPANSITITGNPQKTYDGNPVTDPAVDKTSADGAVSYEYYNDNGGSPAATPLGSAPANAGKYWVKAKVSGSATHADATSDAKSFTIGRAGYTYAGPAVSTTTYVGASYPASESVTATGVGSETVNGTLSWFTDAEYSTAATGTFDAVGEKTLYWKFTPASTETNYKENVTTGETTYTVSALPLQDFTNNNHDAEWNNYL